MVTLLKEIGYYPCQTILFELLLRFIVSDKNRLNIVNDIFNGNEMENVKQYIIGMQLKNYAKVCINYLCFIFFIELTQIKLFSIM